MQDAVANVKTPWFCNPISPRAVYQGSLSRRKAVLTLIAWWKFPLGKIQVSRPIPSHSAIVVVIVEVTKQEDS